MIKIKDITKYIESLAPLSTQESYDNSGLITGEMDTAAQGVLVSLDCTEAVVDEAIAKGCNLIVSHHPIVFKGLKKFNGSNYVERTVIKAIKNDIAIYACHTNLDNFQYGVNYEIGNRMGLKNLKILDPKSKILKKVGCFVPKDHLDRVRESMFESGAGHIGDYTECASVTDSEGSFKPQNEAKPFEGKIGERSLVKEARLEVLVDAHKVGAVIHSMIESHPYEEVAYEIYPILNKNQFIGSGMLGELDTPMSEKDFLTMLKKTFNATVVRHTDLLGKDIRKVAFCGGSGRFLLGKAKSMSADVFVTGDYKYHEFFDAEDQIVIADIGHFESEQFTSNRISELLMEKFPKFAVRLTEVNTNPINYF